MTGITIWGLYDATSWRADSKPLPFVGLYQPKQSFQAVIDALK